VITPTQDMILGIYYLSTVIKNGNGEGIIFGSVDEALRAYASGNVHPHSIIGIDTGAYPKKKFPKQGILLTTIGKIILNNVLPVEMSYINNASNVDHINEEDIVPAGEDPRKIIKA
jgi:DNA-directed RNA polymerase subunit beta'